MRKEFFQWQNMPIGLVPHIPPRIPNMFSEGALEKEMRDIFFTKLIDNTHRWTLEAMLA